MHASMRVQIDPNVNGVAITSSGSGSCYCEKKMSKSNGNPAWKTCSLVHKNDEKDLI